MTTHSKTARLNLEFYKKQAKSLLKSVRAGNDVATDRVRLYASHRGVDPDVAQRQAELYQAQLTIAREQGFPSWTAFKRFIEESNLDFQGLVESFIDAAVSDGARAKAILAENPKIAAAGFYVGLVLGNVKTVERSLSSSPELAKEKSGPQKCEPLLYVCFSRFANPASPHAEGLVEVARLLLQHGADPNTVTREVPDMPLSCVYAASGLNNNPALTKLLLEAGANPDDGESLYHSTEHSDLACFKLLLAHGARLAGSNALKHMLDYEHFEGVRLLLEAGADPNERNHNNETALHWGVWRRRSTQIIAALLNAGADVNAKRNDGRTAYALAKLSGQDHIADLLVARGADTTISTVDSFVASASSGGRKEGASMAVVNFSGNERLLPDLVIAHNTPAVRALLAAGVPIDSRGEHGGTALHWACWHGMAELVKLLLERGASLTIEDHTFRGTPAGWFGHGVRNCNNPHGDYAEVARLLIAAGATVPVADLPTSKPDVDAVLRAHGLIK